MENSRRDFLKKGLAGAILCSGLVPVPLLAMTESRKKFRKAKRILLLSLDGICVAGFRQAKTPYLDKLLAEGVLSETTR